VNCQERSREELLETLRITLEFNKQDALSAAELDFQEEKIARTPLQWVDLEVKTI